MADGQETPQQEPQDPPPVELLLNGMQERRIAVAPPPPVAPSPGLSQPPLPQPAAPEPPRPETHEPAVFPRGFWKSIDYLIHHPEEFYESLRQDRELWKVSGILFVTSLAMAASYGAVMGATNLLQNAPELLLIHKLGLILVVAVKTPILFLLTLGITLPPIYVSNAFMGTRFSLRQVLALLLGTTAIMATVLASMATVAFFFSLTSQSYNFIKLLHVLFFAYAGVMGLGFMFKGIHYLETGTRRRTPRGLFLLWLLLYIFVGTQLGWVLRPFVGSPHEKFQILRPRSGNFYEDVIKSIRQVSRE